MGLDMYLKGKRYLSSHFNKGDDETAQKIAKLFPELKSVFKRNDDRSVKEVTVDIGYWRKANAIHSWFVNNVQDGKDDCSSYHVSRNALMELKELCEAVLTKNKNPKSTLPTAKGFFFGNTDFDEYYYDQLQSTVSIINDALSLPDQWEFEYRSSW